MIQAEMISTGSVATFAVAGAYWINSFIAEDDLARRDGEILANLESGGGGAGTVP
jgi:hypothetical protein